MTDWTSSGGVKIERAKEQIRNLETEIQAFFERSPYKVVPEKDDQAGLIHFRIHMREKPQLRWGAIAGEILHDLRSSLDILWRNVWYPGGGGASDAQIEFFIFDSAERFEARYPLDRFMNARHKSAVDVLYAIKPYKGGNDLLWMLHGANIIDKHRLLIPAYAQHIAFVMKRFPWNSDDSPSWSEALCPVEQGAILLTTTIEKAAEMDMDTQLTLEVVFGEIEIVKDRPLISTLDQITGVVEGTVEAFRRADLIS